MKSIRALGIIALTLPAIALADGNAFPVTLKSAKAPSGKNAWDLPAQLAYLSNSDGDDSYAVNAALSGNLPNVSGTTLQPQITAWIAKNTQLAKKQNKYGLEAAIGYAGGDEHFGYIPQFSVSFDRDEVKHTDERTYQATVDFTSVDVNLAGCGRALVHGCTYWDMLAGVYSNDVHSSASGTGLGRVNGGRLVLKLTSNPFAQGHPLAPVSFAALAQVLHDVSASDSRAKENRKYYRATVSWRFYDEGASVKPSMALERIIGADLLTGQDYQAYTQLSFRLEF